MDHFVTGNNLMFTYYWCMKSKLNQQLCVWAGRTDLCEVWSPWGASDQATGTCPARVSSESWWGNWAWLHSGSLWGGLQCCSPWNRPQRPSVLWCSLPAKPPDWTPGSRWWKESITSLMFGGTFLCFVCSEHYYATVNLMLEPNSITVLYSPWTALNCTPDYQFYFFHRKSKVNVLLLTH